jgi:hypothetical protein
LYTAAANCDAKDIPISGPPPKSTVGINAFTASTTLV